MHRIGRTGRAGAEGTAISLVCADEVKDLIAIEQLIQKHLERKVIPHFAPFNSVPTTPAIRPPKAKKPKKPKAPATDHQDGQRSGENARGHKPTGKNRRHTGQRNEGATANKSASANKGNRRRPTASSATPK